MKIDAKAIGRMHEAIVAAGVQIVTLDTNGNVQPEELQQAAQPIIDAYSPRDELKLKINDLRQIHETAGFSYAGKRFQSDQRSYDRLGGAAQAALTALVTQQPFPAIDWVAEDNSSITLDAAGVLGLHSAFIAHALQLHLYSQDLKARLDDGEEVDIEAGWPA